MTITDTTNDRYVGFVEIAEGCFSIVQRGDKLIAGTVYNVGLLKSYEYDIDDCFSFDENLQAFIETIETMEHDNN